MAEYVHVINTEIYLEPQAIALQQQLGQLRSEIRKCRAIANQLNQQNPTNPPVFVTQFLYGTEQNLAETRTLLNEWTGDKAARLFADAEKEHQRSEYLSQLRLVQSYWKENYGIAFSPRWGQPDLTDEQVEKYVRELAQNIKLSRLN